jgi:hypothetical protein
MQTITNNYKQLQKNTKKYKQLQIITNKYKINNQKVTLQLLYHMDSYRKANLHFQ